MDNEKEPSQKTTVSNETVDYLNRQKYHEYRQGVDKVEESKLDLIEAKKYRSELRRNVGFQVLRLLGEPGVVGDIERATDDVIYAKDRVKEGRRQIAEAKAGGKDIVGSWGEQLQTRAKSEMEADIASQVA